MKQNPSRDTNTRCWLKNYPGMKKCTLPLPLPCLQEPNSELYLEPHESNSHPHMLCLTLINLLSSHLSLSKFIFLLSFETKILECIFYLSRLTYGNENLITCTPLE